MKKSQTGDPLLTYSIKVVEDFKYTDRKGFVLSQSVLKRGTYQVPLDINDKLARAALKAGKAEKHVRKRAAPENKAKA